MGMYLGHQSLAVIDKTIKDFKRAGSNRRSSSDVALTPDHGDFSSLS